MTPKSGAMDEPHGAIWTAGHWTYPEADFLAQLRTQGIDLVADVRSSPGSRRSPQYGRDVMPTWLEPAGIGYTHLDELGGRRSKQYGDHAVNAGWKNASFHNYADYSLSDTYEHGIATLTGLAAHHRVALMCGEPTPWRCHRLLLSNTLTARGWTVHHIIGERPPQVHELGAWGAAPLVDDTHTVTYPDATPHGE